MKYLYWSHSAEPTLTATYKRVEDVGRAWWCDWMKEAVGPTPEYPQGLKSICERYSDSDVHADCGWVRLVPDPEEEK